MSEFIQNYINGNYYMPYNINIDGKDYWYYNLTMSDKKACYKLYNIGDIKDLTAFGILWKTDEATIPVEYADNYDFYHPHYVFGNFQLNLAFPMVGEYNSKTYYQTFSRLDSGDDFPFDRVFINDRNQTLTLMSDEEKKEQFVPGVSYDIRDLLDFFDEEFHGGLYNVYPGLSGGIQYWIGSKQDLESPLCVGKSNGNYYTFGRRTTVNYDAYQTSLNTHSNLWYFPEGTPIGGDGTQETFELHLKTYAIYVGDKLIVSMIRFENPNDVSWLFLGGGYYLSDMFENAKSKYLMLDDSPAIFREDSTGKIVFEFKNNILETNYTTGYWTGVYNENEFSLEYIKNTENDLNGLPLTVKEYDSSYKYYSIEQLLNDSAGFARYNQMGNFALRNCIK